MVCLGVGACAWAWVRAWGQDTGSIIGGVKGGGNGQGCLWLVWIPFAWEHIVCWKCGWS